jgi:hypothetical protein
MDWIELAHDRVLGRASVKTAIKFGFLSNSDIHGQLTDYELLREDPKFTSVRIFISHR